MVTCLFLHEPLLHRDLQYHLHSCSAVGIAGKVTTTRLVTLNRTCLISGRTVPITAPLLLAADSSARGGKDPAGRKPGVRKASSRLLYGRFAIARLTRQVAVSQVCHGMT